MLAVQIEAILIDLTGRDNQYHDSTRHRVVHRRQRCKLQATPERHCVTVHRATYDLPKYLSSLAADVAGSAVRLAVVVSRSVYTCSFS